MAGDWIKMRADLLTHPKVVRMSSALKADKLRVIGGLHATWCLFDAHSTDGKLEGYSAEVLDAHLGWPGFSAAMISILWLIESDECLAAPRFDEHNGQSAKRRATDSERKRLAREEEKSSAEEADKFRTREEKRREEKSKHLTDTEVSVVASETVGQIILPERRKSPDCPHQDIVALYHEVLPQCPAIRDWTPARQEHLRTRWNEDPKRQNLEYWRNLFLYVADCDFLVGKVQTKDRKPFIADLEWIVKSANFTKIREGRYQNEH